MIVPSYTDEQILTELMEDWPSVKRRAKKLGALLLQRMPKGRIGPQAGELTGLHSKFRSKNGNWWSVSAYCKLYTTQWWSVTYCMVENDRGTKSYYYLRGMNTPHQYYVELIPHAVRRIRERYINIHKDYLFADKAVEDVCDWAVFDRHECGIFFKAGKIRGGVFQPFTDGDGNTPGVVLMKNSMFYARLTPRGNFIFKTFIQPTDERDTPKYEFTLMLFGLYHTFNMPKSLNTPEERAKELVMVAQAIPSMKHHLDHFQDKVVPLYP